MRRALVLFALTLGTGVWSWPLSQAAETAEPRIDVEFGYGGEYDPAWPVPVIVSGSAPGPFEARLEVTTRRRAVRGRAAGTISRNLAFEVPAAGPFARVFLVTAYGPLVRLQVAVVGSADPPTAVGLRRVRSLGPVPHEVVGVVAGSAVAARNVALTGLGRAARIVRLTPEHLTPSLATVRGITHIALDGDAVAGLTEVQREAVVAFGASGGDIILAGAVPSGSPALPAAWGQPVRTPSRSRFGLGTVTRVPGTVASWSVGTWQRVIAPLGGRHRAVEVPAIRLAAAMIDGKGLRAPEPRFALPLVVVFLVVIGPGALVALRLRGRLERAWVTSPAIAVVFTIAMVTIGGAYRARPVAGRVDVSTTYRGVASEVVAVARASRYGERHTISLPAGMRGPLTRETDPQHFAEYAPVQATDPPPTIVPVEDLLRRTAVVPPEPGLAAGLTAARFRPHDGAPVGSVRLSHDRFTLSARGGLNLSRPRLLVRGYIERVHLDPPRGDTITGRGSLRNLYGLDFGGLLEPREDQWSPGPGVGEMLPSPATDRAFLIGEVPGGGPHRQRIVIHELDIIRPRGSTVVADSAVLGRNGARVVTRFRLPDGVRVSELTLDGLLPACHALPRRAQEACSTSSDAISQPSGAPPNIVRSFPRTRRDPRFSVFDVTARRWVAITPRLLRATLDPARVVSGLGEVLIRIHFPGGDGETGYLPLRLTGRTS